MSTELDLIIKNSRVIDGTGAPAFQSDLGVKNGKIETIGTGLEESRVQEVIDGRGRVLCPGFIDTHSHDDFLVLIRPTADEKVLQGVTTVVTGNCGSSAGPIVGDSRLYIRELMAFIGGGMVGDDFLDIRTLADYLDKVEDAGPGLNVVPLAGHMAVRYAVLGGENRAPDSGEMARMKVLVEETMEQGAFGLSTGLIYAPGTYASTEELIELSRVVARHGGLYATHLRNEGARLVEALKEALTIGREAGIRVHISHHKASGRNNWGKSEQTLELMARARESGLRVACDQYPYTAASTALISLLPPSYLAKNREEIGRLFMDPAGRKAMARDMESDDRTWENIVQANGFENIIRGGDSAEPIKRFWRNRGPDIWAHDIFFQEKQEVLYVQVKKLLCTALGGHCLRRGIVPRA